MTVGSRFSRMVRFGGKPKGKVGAFGIRQAFVSSKFRAFTALGVMAVYGVLEAIFALFVNRLFEAVGSAGGMWATIAAPLSILISLWLFQIILQIVSLLVRYKLEIIYTKHMLNRIFIHLSEIEQSVLDSSNTGEIVARTVEDTKIASKAFIRPFTRSLTSIIIFISTLVVLITIAWEPALILAGISLVIGVVTIFATKRLETLSESSREQSSLLWGALFEAFKNIKFIKVNNLQENYRENVRKSADLYQDRESKTKKFSIALSTVQQVLFLCSWAATLAIAIYYNTTGALTVAGVVSFLVSGNQLRAPLIEVVGEVQELRAINVSFQRLNKLMEFQKFELSQKVVALNKPDLCFQNVDFSYDGKKQLLENASFTLKYGRTYAIVGKTGSGKSTIFDIFTGSYPVQKGKVLVGKMPLDRHTIFTARNAISISFQMPYLLNDTIEYNVRLLNPKIAHKELEKILHITQVDQIISKLPEGLQSKVGENGVQLSGGERKRIQIAQSLAKDAQVYMFDELTASLDQKTARTMMASIKEHLKGKTVVFIEHRLNMIEDVDVIYEFKNKTIEEVALNQIADR